MRSAYDDRPKPPSLSAEFRQLLVPGDMHTLLNEIVRAALEITGADMGNIQMADDAEAWTAACDRGARS